jgi:hypothetical protein
MTVERIDIVITEKGGKVVKRSIDDIADSAKKADTDISKLGKTAGIVGGIVGAALGGAATLLYTGFANAAKNIDETAKASKQLGIGVENMSRLDFAARSADLTTQDLVGAVQSLQRAQTQAAKPGSEMNKLFAQMGINAVDATGKLRGSEAVLRDVADLFQRMPDGANKSALALKLFGSENQNVIGLLNQGSRGLDEMAKKSDELGYTLSGETAKGVQEFYNELDDVRLQIEAVYRQALPGLLPMLKEFSGLLNSQEFKDGFNAIVQGAAQTIIWLTKMATTVANVTKFLAEEIAARAGGTDPRDTVRVEQRIERLKGTIADLQEMQQKPLNPIVAIKAIYSPNSEVGAGDLLRSPAAVIKRLQGELNQEQNKLKVGIELNDADAAKALAAAQAAAQGKPAGGPAPAIDWTALGRTPKGPKGPKGPDPIKELQRLQNELDNTVGRITPVLAAQHELASAQDTFNRAIDKGLISQQQANAYMELYEEQLKDQLKPLEAVTDRLNDEIKLAGMLNEERQVEAQMLQITDQLKRAGIKTTEDQNAALREQLVLLQKTDKLAAAKEAFLQQSKGKRDEKAGIDIKALGELVKGGQIGGADTFNIVNQMLGGSLDDTQSAFDARMAQFDEYYQRIAKLRAADVLNAQQAAEAMNAIDEARRQFQIDRVQSGLGTIAQLMGSHNKTAFKIGQAAAIAQVAISTPQAAMDAYKSLSGIPYVGPFLGAAAAAAAVAFGAMQISKIRSQTPPAFRTGGSMVVGGHGGVDSQTVAFRATPGERVSINTPAQARALERSAEMSEQSMPRGDINMNLTVVQQGRADNRTPEQNAREMRKQARKMGVV